MLIKILPQEDYRETFLKLTHELAPPASGTSFNQTEIKSTSDFDPQPVILRPDTRKAIKNVLKKPEIVSQDFPEHIITQLKGTLRGLQLDKDWIEVNIDGKTERLYEAKELDDVIEPMVDRRVVETVCLYTAKAGQGGS